LNEVNLNQLLEKLDILVKEKIYVPPKEQIINYDKEIDSDGNIDYDSIGLQSIRSCHFKDSKIQANVNNVNNVNKNFKNLKDDKEINNSKNNTGLISDEKFKAINEQNKVLNNNNINLQLNNIKKNNSQNTINNNYTFEKNNNINNNVNDPYNNNPNTKNNNNPRNNYNNNNNKMNKDPNKNFSLFKTRTEELEIITEKQPKFEFTNCISFFGRSDNENKANESNSNKNEKLGRNKKVNFSTTKNNIKKKDNCLIF